MATNGTNGVSKTGPHPLDPLTESEIEVAATIVRKAHPDLFFNAITLWEPRKAEIQAWLADPNGAKKPSRAADVVCIGKGSKVYDGVVDLMEGKIVKWELTEGVQPLVSFSPALLVTSQGHRY
jgi:primary-amine oxidase